MEQEELDYQNLTEFDYNSERFAAEFTEVTFYCLCGNTKTIKYIDPTVVEDDDVWTCTPCQRKAWVAPTYGKMVLPPDGEDVPF